VRKSLGVGVAAAIVVVMLPSGCRSTPRPRQASSAPSETVAFGECPMSACPPPRNLDGGVADFEAPKGKPGARTYIPMPPGGLSPCPDGNHSYGFTGRCVRERDGNCRWEQISCPAPESKP